MATCNACGADRRTGICPFCGQRSRVRDDDGHGLRSRGDEGDETRNAERIDRMPVYDASPIWNVDR